MARPPHQRSQRPRRAALLAAALLALASGVRADGPAAPVAPPPARRAAEELEIGFYEVGQESVVDGDTLRVGGLGSVRIACLDCEEVFKDARAREAAMTDFAAYAAAQRGANAMPVKFATPAGEAARTFVRELFVGVTRVRLERDEARGHDLDGFERRLAHVILLGGASERNLAVEVVRAGHSPYFVKYGRSLRFDAPLCLAQAEAQAARRGVWGAEGPAHYPDYAARLTWWEQRAQQLDAWRKEPVGPERIELGTVGAAQRLAARVGQPVVLLGTLRATYTEHWPHILWLSDRRGADVAAVVHDQAVWAALDHEGLAQRFATVRGPVSLFRGRPQVEITHAEQVSTR